MKGWITFAVALAALVGSAHAQSISGRASVIDGDTLDIQGQRIRLHGVDAPESGQTCKDSAGKVYRCGQKAALALADQIGTSAVTCEQTDKDRYGRIVAQCHQPDLDINSWLVSEGYAMAYRQYGTEYVPEEETAREAKKGIWAGTFTPPWDWRRGERTMGVPAVETLLSPSPQVAQTRSRQRTPDPEEEETEEASSSTGFSCGGKRVCGQMNSCAEARFYLNQCGLGRLDRDNDGIPCESICR